MTGPDLSVIVPMHNGEATIDRCLKSLLGQRCGKSFEVIVVDDASADQGPELVKKLPVRLVSLAQNLGAGGARNRGAREAQGEILVFVDSDVYLVEGSLEKIVVFFDRHPEYSGLVGNYTPLPADQNFCSVYHNWFTAYHHDLSREDIEWFWGALSAVGKEVFGRLSGFSEAYPGASAEDIELGYRLSESGHKIRYFPELRGIHGRRFGIANMLYNDYHKSVLGLKLYLKRKPTGKHPHGFSGLINGLNLVLAPLIMLCFLSLPISGMILLWLLLSAVFIALNFKFHRGLGREAGLYYLLPSLLLHWLSFNAIALGVLGGLIGLALGKGLESKSRWV